MVTAVEKRKAGAGRQKKQRQVRPEPWRAPMSRLWGEEKEPAKEMEPGQPEKMGRAWGAGTMRGREQAAES